MAATKYAVVYGTTLTYPYEKETLHTFISVNAAMNWMHKRAKDEATCLFHSFADLHIYATSDSRYPDAWGYGNNGIEIECNGQIYSYLVEEVNNNN